MTLPKRIKHHLVFHIPSKLRFLLSDETVIRAQYREFFGEDLNLASPQTLCEKLQWLKLYDRNPLMTQCADKFAVRKFVERKVGAHILNDLHAVFNRAREIDFGALPAPCILKVTNCSGANILIREKGELDIARARKNLKQWSRKNPYFWFREWSYKNISPKIVCEKFMAVDSLMECKFFCFHGEPRVVQVLVKRSPQDLLKAAAFYDVEWQKLDFWYDNPLIAEYDWHTPEKSAENPPPEKVFKRPAQFAAMLEVARALSGEFRFVRVDLYDFNGKIIFGELTFYPFSGRATFHPKNADRELGELLTLPVKK